MPPIPWTYTSGPVTAYERPDRQGVVYLQWRATTGHGRNWARRSLGFAVRDAHGRLDRAKVREAEAAAHQQVARLAGALPVVATRPALTLAEGWALARDPDHGKYPTDTPHRREVERAMQYAMAVWGPGRTWATLTRRDLLALGRQRCRELRAAGARGLRGAEVTLARILAVAQWLRDEALIPADACVPRKHWKQGLAADWRELTQARGDYTPDRPRHTVEEFRRLLTVAASVEPRLGLALALGAELRPGQVLRARRSDLDLEAGTFTVPSRGHKRGAVVYLTAGQRRAVDEALAGYLAALEREGGDYPLFPAGQLTGGRSGQPHATARHRTAPPVDRGALRRWFRAAEVAAGIPHVPGRGPYGLRRAMVDGAKAEAVSADVLKELGGWADTQMPDRVYADQASDRARHAARAARAAIRGETDA